MLNVIMGNLTVSIMLIRYYNANTNQDTKLIQGNIYYKQDIYLYIHGLGDAALQRKRAKVVSNVRNPRLPYAPFNLERK